MNYLLSQKQKMFLNAWLKKIDKLDQQINNTMPLDKLS